MKVQKWNVVEETFRPFCLVAFKRSQMCKLALDFINRTSGCCFFNTKGFFFRYNEIIIKTIRRRHFLRLRLPISFQREMMLIDVTLEEPSTRYILSLTTIMSLNLQSICFLAPQAFVQLTPENHLLLNLLQPCFVELYCANNAFIRLSS